MAREETTTTPEQLDPSRRAADLWEATTREHYDPAKLRRGFFALFDDMASRGVERLANNREDLLERALGLAFRAGAASMKGERDDAVAERDEALRQLRECLAAKEELVATCAQVADPARAEAIAAERDVAVTGRARSDKLALRLYDKLVQVVELIDQARRRLELPDNYGADQVLSTAPCERDLIGLSAELPERT